MAHNEPGLGHAVEWVGRGRVHCWRDGLRVWFGWSGGGGGVGANEGQACGQAEDDLR